MVGGCVHMRMCECEGGGTEEIGTSSRVSSVHVCEGTVWYD